MLFGSLHAKMMEQEKKASPIDGRTFNRRSRAKMNREVNAIAKTRKKAERRKESRRGLYNGVFSEEEIREGEIAKKQFQEDMRKKKELKDQESQNGSQEEPKDVPTDEPTKKP